MKHLEKFAAGVVLILLMASAALAMDWPQWRGPYFNGSTRAKGLPASWTAERIAWVRRLPGPSGATPVIADGRVFVTSTVEGAPEFGALCFDQSTGERLWWRKVGADARRFPRNNMASPSPATDGKRVFFLYADGTLVGFDVEGHELWRRNIEKEYGNLALQFGYSNSPLLYDGRLYVVVFRRNKPYRGQDPGIDGPLDSFLLAVDPATGQTLWKQPRKTDAFDEGMETYMTPIPFERDGKVELLATGADFITSHDPQTGEELWRFEYWTDKVRDSRVIPTLVTGEGLIFGARHKHNPLFALKPPSRDGKGGRILWEFGGPSPDCSTPLFYEGRLYVLDGLKRKTVTCVDPRTGREFWQGRLPGSRPWWASLTAGDGKVYCINEDGLIVVLRAGGGEFEVLFETTIDEPDIQSSIAIADGHLFIRTAENLYCIGD